ncbi:MAG: Bax inhibitor-1/YccA family protein [Rickettsiales bacterium]|jgi:FtsH-binding integral membrane protein|nr:Bax inhibitor-1/YccA family protein [Rickettsiales bacterium]
MPAKITKTSDISLSGYFKKVFLTMAAAVGITALTIYLSLTSLAQVVWPMILNNTGTGFSTLYYILVFGGLGMIIFAQARLFSMSKMAALAFLFAYSVIMGITMMPLIMSALSIDPALIFRAFFLAALMLASMAMFGYRTEKDLSFLRVFLLAGMIGLILVGISSIFFPFGAPFAMAVSAIGVLVFALFTAYDMQALKRIFGANGLSPEDADKFVVMGAIHMYISFIAMFQYLLNLMSLSRN